MHKYEIMRKLERLAVGPATEDKIECFIEELLDKRLTGKENDGLIF